MSTTTPLAQATDANPWHARLARHWLKFDLFLCAVVALNAVLALSALPSLEPDSFEALRARLEGTIGSGISLLGITGNVLLLCGKRIGLWPARGSLLCVAVGIGASIWLANYMVTHVDEIDCDPQSVVAGVIVGIALRLSVNFLYVLALARVARELPRNSRPARIGSMEDIA